MATALCPDHLRRLVPFPFHRWYPDPRHWNGYQRCGVLAWYLSLHRILWDLQVLHIPLPECVPLPGMVIVLLSIHFFQSNVSTLFGVQLPRLPDYVPEYLWCA